MAARRCRRQPIPRAPQTQVPQARRHQWRRGSECAAWLRAAHTRPEPAKPCTKEWAACMRLGRRGKMASVLATGRLREP
eukprot:7384734-Prymnesium_polylepis.1